MDASHRPVQPDIIDLENFDREIVLGVPNEEDRWKILTDVLHGFKLEDSCDLVHIARSTQGFIRVDLEQLVKEAENLAMRKVINKIRMESPEEDSDWFKKSYHLNETDFVGITMMDFQEAIIKFQPSLKKEWFSIIPEVKWEEDIGGMEPIRHEFMRSIVQRIKNPDDMNVQTEKGFLLYGPTGCGKTLIAKAVVNEAGASFIHIKGLELLQKYGRESEWAVKTMFHRAKIFSPCIIFFDQVDILMNKRGKESDWVLERLLNQLLIELDSCDDTSSIFIIAATYRPDVIDDAFLRPGRLGKHLHVGLPSPEDRGFILKSLARNKPIDPSVDLLEVGKACDNYSGADLRAFVNEAAMAARDERKIVLDLSTIHRRHFDLAFQRISPSVSLKDIRFYDNWSHQAAGN